MSVIGFIAMFPVIVASVLFNAICWISSKIRSFLRPLGSEDLIRGFYRRTWQHRLEMGLIQEKMFDALYSIAAIGGSTHATQRDDIVAALKCAIPHTTYDFSRLPGDIHVYVQYGNVFDCMAWWNQRKDHSRFIRISKVYDRLIDKQAALGMF